MLEQKNEEENINYGNSLKTNTTNKITKPRTRTKQEQTNDKQNRKKMKKMTTGSISKSFLVNL